MSAECCLQNLFVAMRRLGMIGGIERRSACDRRRSSPMDGILKRAVYPPSPRAAVEKLQDTPLLPQSLVLTSGGYT